ncbi:uncharacterized protein EI97DRAFT_483499 [Westerdykella ornata]|uniref:Uncharacterized protein n=1 Tax=Westerdykella ornata TaxID=318751 RepID=A0A6A6J903_WESOR|nr:uncharacterized protein EI97DRAFT_483499 [Westerdykella ornata]KAF2272684.1 hypothetical protein EI97DRAFT_483499 [Westerdykella ornata]
MAKSIDDLIEFILEEIALCGAQGAGSADFRRFVEQFHKENERQAAGSHAWQPHVRIDRAYLEKVWEWLRINQDVRMVYANETRSLSLSDFEALEMQETGTNGSVTSTHPNASHAGDSNKSTATQISPSLLQSSFRGALRQRLSKEVGNSCSSPAEQQARFDEGFGSSSAGSAHMGLGRGESSTLDNGVVRNTMQHNPHTGGSARQPVPYATVPGQTGVRVTGDPFSARRPKRGIRTTGPIFDELTPTTTAPRIYVSQNRTWHAVAGHSMDFKRLSAMKFVLLSIIASRGPEGINQPELTVLSGQDKRSVPARTDELAKDGYIEKSPVASRNGPTSRCVHKRFIKGDHYLRGTGNHQDVFRGRTVIFAQLVALIYSVLKDVKILPYSQLRGKLGISYDDLSTTGMRSAIRRLEETGLLAKKRIWKTGTRKTTTIVVQLLREPNDDDVKNFRFRYQNTIRQPPSNNLDEDDEEGDDGMGDLDLDLDLGEEGTEIKRIPPQWTPEKLLPNLFFQAVELSGSVGVDSAGLRDRTMGMFWRRPTESYIARMTDDWENSQPHHLRHLALIRDTRVTSEKKTVHYVYRTYENFQKAVDDKLASWDAVSREAGKQQKAGQKAPPLKPTDGPLLNEWGFPDIPKNLFHLGDGSATLAQCSAAANTGRQNLEKWANMNRMGFRKRKGAVGSDGKPIKRGRPRKVKPSDVNQAITAQASESPQATGEPPDPRTPAATAGVAAPLSTEPTINKVRKSMQLAVPLLSKEQREILGLPPRGRLGKFIEDQIKEHRQRTGDSTSLPDVIYKSPADMPQLEQETPVNMKEKRKNGVPDSRLFTREFRRQHGLPEKGRLAQDVIDRFRRLESERTSTGNSPEAEENMPAPGGTECHREHDAPLAKPADLSTPTPHGTKRKNDTPEMASQAVKRLRRDSDILRTSVEHITGPITSRETLPTESIVASGTCEGTHTPDLCSPGVTIHRQHYGSPLVTRTMEVVDPLSKSPNALPSVEVPRGPRISDAFSASATATARNQLKRPTATRQLEHRSKPGLYINPYVLRPRGRGRPKKSLMAVFKLPGLRDLNWFKEAADKISNEKVTERRPAAERAVSQPVHAASLVLQSTTAIAEPPPVGNAAALQPGIISRTQSPTQFIDSVGSDKTIETTHLDARSSAVPERADPDAPVSPVTPPTIPEIPVSGRNTDDVSMNEIQPLEVRTPEAPVQRSPSEEITSGRARTDVPSGNGVYLVSGIAYAPSHKQPKPVGAFSKKGVVRSRGSNWYARVELILYILKLCGGVFPFNGELLKVFHQLWDERAHKRGSKPDRTTLTNTVNAMLEDPECGLQKFGFWVSTRSSQARLEKMERYMLALPGIDPSHPKVQEVKDKIAEHYPHKWYPPEVNHLAPPEGPARGPKKPRFDASLTLDGITPNVVQRVNQQIFSSAEKRREKAEKKKMKEHEARVALSGRGAQRKRLEGLTRRLPREKKGRVEPIPGSVEGEGDRDVHGDMYLSASRLGDAVSRSPSPATSSSEDVEMELLQQRRRESLPMGTFEDGFHHLTVEDFHERQLALALLNSESRYYANTGTYSTDFGGFAARNLQWVAVPSTAGASAEHEWTFIKERIPKGVKRKRVQFEDVDESPQAKDGRKRARRWSPDEPEPTVVERLSGRMGNAEDPIYVPPTKKSYRTPKRWADMKPRKRKRDKEDEKAEKPLTMKALRSRVEPPLDAAETFKKLFCTLAIAYIMSGQGDIDWRIPSKVYEAEPRFKVEKMKKLWSWVQTNMQVQLRSFTTSFENAYLEAYEQGNVDVLEDPDTYDWAALVRWALITCDYSEPPLPRVREALHHYSIEESSYRLFDRSQWAISDLAHVKRANSLLKYSYAAPIHTKPLRQPEEDILLARSWIRSNIATPEAVYNSHVAHDKLVVLGEATLERAIADMTREQQIRMRKIKRLLPGRNFHFTARFGVKYRKPFELDDFVDAVNFKKRLDAAFAHAEPDKRVHCVSRTADDGSVMALLSLVAAGQVRIEPVLPPIKNELRAPAPRISVWGFIEGDYAHRKIDRRCLFWDIHAVPTGSYEFGNPLQPSSAPDPGEDKAEWVALPEPPLPGKRDGMAKLPIWSTIDGTRVIWPWWYRVLNVVLQGLMFQPGSSVRELHSYCPGGSVELFEVEHVVEYLVAVGAAECRRAASSSSSASGGRTGPKPEEGRYYSTTQGFWAVFGEALRDMESDTFKEHVKRTRLREYREALDVQFNLRSRKIDALMRPQGEGEGEDDGEGEGEGYVGGESGGERSSGGGSTTGVGAGSGGGGQGQNGEDIVMQDAGG